MLPPPLARSDRPDREREYPTTQTASDVSILGPPESVLSDALGQMVRLRVTTRGLKTIEHNGGLDAFLLSTNDSVLPTESRRLKKRVQAALAKKQAAAAV